MVVGSVAAIGAGLAAIGAGIGIGQHPSCIARPIYQRDIPAFGGKIQRTVGCNISAGRDIEQRALRYSDAT